MIIMHVYNNTKVLFMNFGNQNFNIHVLKDAYNFTEVNIQYMYVFHRHLTDMFNLML